MTRPAFAGAGSAAGRATSRSYEQRDMKTGSKT